MQQPPRSQGPLPHPLVGEELSLLDAVSAALAVRSEPETASEASLIEELERIREELLRGGLDLFDRSALNVRWDVQSALLAQLRASRSTPRVDPRSPYFAHLRLQEGDRERDLCLGKATFLEGGLRIVDWRHAPIARLFYRYRQGDDYEEDLGGRTFAGRVVARRTVAIREGLLERVDAPEGVFVAEAGEPARWRRLRMGAPRLGGGEGAALRLHSRADGGSHRFGTDRSGVRRRAEKRLPDIAGLLDAEQFALIARPSVGFVAIRGSAGSGKTTVALHRIAFLAFDDPEIDSERSLVVVFSRALRDYVSHVLPALGVKGVRVTTFRDWAAEQRRRLLPRLPSETRSDTPAVVQRLKLHPALLEALERQVARVPGEPTQAQVLDDWMSVLTQRRLLGQVFGERAPGAFSARELDHASDWCRARHEELSAWLDGDEDAPGELDAEDDALLLRAWQLRIGPLPGPRGAPLRYRHVAIDEVQDLSPLEVRVLLDCLDEGRSLTLAGDTQQHVSAGSGFLSWTEFFRHLGVAGTEVSTLQVSYRSSQEIAEFASALLGSLREDEPPRATRSGPPVDLFEFTDGGACAAFLADALIALAQDEPLASVAVLTPSREASELLHAGLLAGDVPRLHLVRQQDFRFAPGVEVTEIEQAKGLEFDYVILAEVDDAHFPDEPARRRLLHVGASRAVHQLWVASTGPMARIVRAAGKAGR
jgi:DNA helicase-2/ATP-dependent DNA helicase PcrA